MDNNILGSYQAGDFFFNQSIVNMIPGYNNFVGGMDFRAMGYKRMDVAEMNYFVFKKKRGRR